MSENLPIWCKTILSLKDNNEDYNYFSLNDLAIKRLKQCKTNKSGTIPYKEVKLKLCRSFSISKKDCMSLLRYFKAIDKIEFIRYNGIKII